MILYIVQFKIKTCGDVIENCRHIHSAYAPTKVKLMLLHCKIIVTGDARTTTYAGNSASSVKKILTSPSSRFAPTSMRSAPLVIPMTSSLLMAECPQTSLAKAILLILIAPASKPVLWAVRSVTSAISFITGRFQFGYGSLQNTKSLTLSADSTNYTSKSYLLIK